MACYVPFKDWDYQPLLLYASKVDIHELVFRRYITVDVSKSKAML